MGLHASAGNITYNKIGKMAGAAFQEFAYDRQGAFNKVEKACNVAEANAILETLRASAGNVIWNKISNMAKEATKDFPGVVGVYNKVIVAKTVAQADAIIKSIHASVKH